MAFAAEMVAAPFCLWDYLKFESPIGARLQEPLLWGALQTKALEGPAG